jgi:hypothetical protein
VVISQHQLGTISNGRRTIRTYSPRREQIYSLPRLSHCAARPNHGFTRRPERRHLITRLAPRMEEVAMKPYPEVVPVSDTPGKGHLRELFDADRICTDRRKS